MTLPFFTIGHSTHPIADFVALLRAAGATQVVDVRTVPRSRTNPQFNRDTVGATLSEFQVGYVHVASLGGLRGRQSAEASPNTFWDNISFRNYADYALSEAFRSGLDELRRIGSQQRTAIMCAEAVWWRCHRRIIADYLLACGEQVFHILSADHIEPAHLTPAARAIGKDRLIYPPEGGSEG